MVPSLIPAALPDKVKLDFSGLVKESMDSPKQAFKSSFFIFIMFFTNDAMHYFGFLKIVTKNKKPRFHGFLVLF